MNLKRRLIDSLQRMEGNPDAPPMNMEGFSAGFQEYMKQTAPHRPEYSPDEESEPIYQQDQGQKKVPSDGLEEIFLQRIAVEPQNWMHKLVYADWLEERVDPR